jgi:hypothetical protein
MPLTAGSLDAGTNLYSLTVVMPDESGASAPPFICFNSSLEMRPPGPPDPMAP